MSTGGLIDPDYTGPLKVILQNGGVNAYKVKMGDRIAQLVIFPMFSHHAEYFDLDDMGPPLQKMLTVTSRPRGTGGLGSTGK